MEEKIEEIAVHSDDDKQVRVVGLGKRKKIGVYVLVLLALVVVFFVLFLVFPCYRLYKDGVVAYQNGVMIKKALSTQNLREVRKAIGETKSQFKKVESDVNILGWTRFIPLFGSYTSDLSHGVKAVSVGLDTLDIASLALEPYADVLGFSGQGSFSGGTAEDRMVKLVETLDKLGPQIDLIAQKFEVIKTEVDAIDPNRYPVEFKSKIIRANILGIKNVIDLTGQVLSSARPMVKELPALLGAKKEAKYMFLFQNDKELRPTGGFITAYAIFRVEKGRLYLETADDIYKLDDTVKKLVSPPEQISKYLNVYGWRLRDANFSPDFKTSMKSFLDIYAFSRDKKELDGIVAVDTHFLVSLLDVLGPIEIYGTKFTTEKVSGCDCPMVVYELLKQAGAPRNYWTDNRKDMIGVLLSSMMKKALASPKQIYGQLFQTAMQQALEKHLLVYLENKDAQMGVEALGLGGVMRNVAKSDYLAVVDTNLAGAKSNLYVVGSVNQEITVGDSGADVTLKLEYRYPHAADNCSLERKDGLCLAGIYRDYLRVYLPGGAKIIEARGFENKSSTFEDLGHVVVDGYFTVVPQGLAKIEIKYRVFGQFKKDGEYRILIQKQAGTVGNHYVMVVNGKKQSFDLKEDKEIVVKL